MHLYSVLRTLLYHEINGSALIFIYDHTYNLCYPCSIFFEHCPDSYPGTRIELICTDNFICDYPYDLCCLCSIFFERWWHELSWSHWFLPSAVYFMHVLFLESFYKLFWLPLGLGSNKKVSFSTKISKYLYSLNALFSIWIERWGHGFS